MNTIIALTFSKNVIFAHKRDHSIYTMQPEVSSNNVRKR